MKVFAWMTIVGIVLLFVLAINFLQTDYNRSFVIYNGFIPSPYHVYLHIVSYCFMFGGRFGSWILGDCVLLEGSVK